MKTSIDLPDDLYRRVKARGALEGRSVREVATELFRAWVDGDVSPKGSDAAGDVRTEEGGQAAWLYEWSVLGARVDRPDLVSGLQQDRH